MAEKKHHRLGAHAYHGGVRFGVWAPFAKTVFVSGSFNNWGRTPMECADNGCWYTDIAGALPGQEYKFVMSSGSQELVRNDPRALQLTTTMSGCSVIVDPAFDWQGDDFRLPPKEEQVIYELHVGTFSRPDPATTGTFDDVREKLGYLKELGINLIELMPINSMSYDRGWGYATDYIYAVESLYGGRQGFLEFVRAAHQHGIGVVLDIVFNHFGPDPSGLDLWQFDGWNQNGMGGIYFYNDNRAETPWGQTRPDFGRPEVQDYILGSISLWMADCHVDGLRVDSTIYIRNVKGQHNDPEHDLPDGWRMLQRVTDLARKIRPDCLLIAEDVAANDYITAPCSAGGAGFKAQWELGYPRVMREALGVTDDGQRNVAGVCEQLLKTFNGDPFQRVIYSDSHDSAANGSARLSEQISPGSPASPYARKRSLLASSLVLTAPGIPMLFQGQEFVEGGSFNDWQELDWQKAEHHQGIVLAHRHLIALRRNLHGVTGGLTGRNCSILHTDWDNNVLAYHRWKDGGPRDDTVVILNFNNRTHREYHINFPHTGRWQVRFNSCWSGYSPDFKDIPFDSVEVNDQGAIVKLAPYSVVILSQD